MVALFRTIKIMRIVVSLTNRGSSRRETFESLNSVLLEI